MAENPEQETILVTEDEKIVRDLVATILKEQGYQVLTASDGQEAIRVFRERKDRIDLLLTDMVMPGMSGPELAQALIQLQPALKILYMSGYTEYAAGNQGIYERVESFIWKPFSPTALVQKIRELLGGRAAPSAE